MAEGVEDEEGGAEEAEGEEGVAAVRLVEGVGEEAAEEEGEGEEEGEEGIGLRSAMRTTDATSQRPSFRGEGVPLRTEPALSLSFFSQTKVSELSQIK